MTNIWDKAEIQTHKEIQTFDDIIRPKLLSYYKTTGEDIYINLNEYGKHTLPIVFYTDNYDLGYKIQEVRTIDLHDREYITDKEVEVTDIRYIDPLNIKVVRVFLDHWDKIVLRLEERLNQLYKDCSIMNEQTISN